MSFQLLPKWVYVVTGYGTALIIKY
jgi:hypothetical protein